MKLKRIIGSAALVVALSLSWKAIHAATPATNSTIHVQADKTIHTLSRLLTGACIEDVNHEIYGGIYSQMIFGESFQEPPPKDSPEISGMWGAVHQGSAIGRYVMASDHPFIGTQSQQIIFDSGDGEVGIENQGLNRWGMNFVQGKPYEGYVWAKAEKPVNLVVAMQSRDGSHVYAEQPLAVSAGDWQKIPFTLTPSGSDTGGRLALLLRQPGSVTLGHVFLQPGDWGRFKGLPVRRDVAQGMIDQGITVLRYGGSMANAAGYRWKNMIGPRDRRPPYAGHWYHYSTNGWGIPDFMNFCEAAGFEYVPDFNIDETPQDMTDFIDYAEAPAGTTWGDKRAGDGHPTPYQLKYMELGNEEHVNDAYADKFVALATAIWAKDPKMILVVGDFSYKQPITDPFHFTGAASHITTLAPHQRIMQFAKRHGAQVWFDVHVSTDHPVPVNASLDGMFSFTRALEKIADGASPKVVVFEFNAGNHGMKRALANAVAINAIERDGRTAIVCSANGLQPDKENDNKWDQGLLFLNPSQVWLQPPGYVTQMFSKSYQPQSVQCDVVGGASFDVDALRSDDGKTLVLQVVNPGDTDAAAQITIKGFTPTKPTAELTELSGPPDGVNTAENSNAIVPKQNQWPCGPSIDQALHTFPAHSVTIIRFE